MGNVSNAQLERIAAGLERPDALTRANLERELVRAGRPVPARKEDLGKAVQDKRRRPKIIRK